MSADRLSDLPPSEADRPAQEDFALARRGLPLPGAVPADPRAAWLPAAARSRVPWQPPAAQPVPVDGDEEEDAGFELPVSQDGRESARRSDQAVAQPPGSIAPAFTAAGEAVPATTQAAAPTAAAPPATAAGEPPVRQPLAPPEAGDPLQAAQRMAQPIMAGTTGALPTAAMAQPHADSATDRQLTDRSPQPSSLPAAPVVRAEPPLLVVDAMHAAAPTAEPAAVPPGPPAAPASDAVSTGTPVAPKASPPASAGLQAVTRETAPRQPAPRLAPARQPAPSAAPAEERAMGLPSEPVMASAMSPVPGGAPDLTLLLSPLPAPPRSVVVERVSVTVQSPPAPQPARQQAPASQAAPVAAPAPRGFRNPWASYHARRD